MDQTILAGEQDRKVRAFLEITAVVGIGWCLFQLYAAAVTIFDMFIMRPIHVAFALLLCFVSYPLLRKRSTRLNWVDYGAAGLSAFIGIYVLLNLGRITTRIQFVDSLTLSTCSLGRAPSF